jgi:hypothetical protein
MENWRHLVEGGLMYIRISVIPLMNGTTTLCNFLLGIFLVYNYIIFPLQCFGICYALAC